MKGLTQRVFELSPPGGIFDETVISNLYPDRSQGARVFYAIAITYRIRADQDDRPKTAPPGGGGVPGVGGGGGALRRGVRRGGPVRRRGEFGRR